VFELFDEFVFVVELLVVLLLGLRYFAVDVFAFL
jgi:hypothetical protein